MPEGAPRAKLPLPTMAQLPIRVETLTYVAGGQRLVDVRALEIGVAGPTMILGPNGAGKSLFLRLLHGLIEPTSGKVLFAGHLADKALRRQQAMVFQKPVLLRRSVAANITYALAAHGVPRRGRRALVEHLLRKGNLVERGHQPARTLSGGEQQRLALVRALASDPAILFLDEPTSSLDPAASHDIEALIGQAAHGGTKIIMVTHDLGLAQRLADEIVFLHLGRVVEQRPAEDFFKQPRSAYARAFLASKLLLKPVAQG
jgi:tungstate transport system ATP-binding protein